MQFIPGLRIIEVSCIVLNSLASCFDSLLFAVLRRMFISVSLIRPCLVGTALLLLHTVVLPVSYYVDFSYCFVALPIFVRRIFPIPSSRIYLRITHDAIRFGK